MSAVNYLTEAEGQALSQFYESELETRQHVVALDPRSASAWYQVAGAATFAGAVGLADDALWRSMHPGWGAWSRLCQQSGPVMSSSASESRRRAETGSGGATG